MTDIQRKSYPGLLYTDPGFQPDQSPILAMNIFINESQLIFSIVNEEHKCLQHVQSFNFFQFTNQSEFYSTIHDVLDKEDLFNLNYQKISVFTYSAYNTLIPSEVFDADKLRAYHQFNFDSNIQFDYTYDLLEELEVVNIYGIQHELKKVFEHKFKNIRFFHNSTALIHYLNKLSAHDEQVYVYVQPNLMQVMITQKQKLLLYNSFTYTTPEDFIYYLLYTYQQLKLNTETVPVYMLGEIVKESVLFELLFKYIRNIHFMKRPAELQIQSTFNMPGHFYFNLFCAGL